MAEEFEEKTERATPRKRQKAREKGDTARSRDLTSLVPLWTFFMYFSFGGFMFTALISYLRSALKRSFEVQISEFSLVSLLKSDSAEIGLMMAPFFGMILLFIAVVHFFQTGFLFTASPLVPNFSKLNPISGIKKFFSINALFETLKGLLKIVILGFILYHILKKEIFNFPLLIDMDIASIIFFSHEQIRKFLLIAAIVLTIFAIADYAYQRWQFEKNIRMSKQDIKDEYKQVEGDPKVKARIRSLQRDFARKRMMQEVPKADVVITNPTHYAIALKYDSLNMGAPVVVAKGANIIAGRIKEIAQSSGIPVFEDKPLARALFKLNVGQEIPEIFYKAVATILANVYKLKKKNLSAESAA